ncbi:MAG: hypothetical protein AB7S75_00950 [Desulfococcaceae bacterium]
MNVIKICIITGYVAPKSYKSGKFCNMWKCKKCGEEIEDQFDSCWNCEQPVESAPHIPPVKKQQHAFRSHGRSYASAPHIPPVKKQQPITLQNMEVTVADIKMPFWSMVIFLVKLSIAAIPATIIIAIISSVLIDLFTRLMGNSLY